MKLGAWRIKLHTTTFRCVGVPIAPLSEDTTNYAVHGWFQPDYVVPMKDTRVIAFLRVTKVRGSSYGSLFSVPRPAILIFSLKLHLNVDRPLV